MTAHTYTTISVAVHVFTLIVMTRVQSSFHAHTIKNHIAVNEELLIRRSKVSDWMSCIVACQSESKCFSYNYQYTNYKNGLCELLECGMDQSRDFKEELFYSYGFLFQQLKQYEKMKSCSTGCGKGWKPFRRHCYKAIEHKKSWGEASKFCKDKGGNLASIHSQEEHNFLVSMGSSLSMPDFWIGLAANITCDKDGPSYSDGTSLTYKAFPPFRGCPCVHQPDTCKCVKSKKQQWFYTNCKEYAPFICKI